VQPQDLAVTIFGIFLRGEGELAWSGGMVRLLGDFGVSEDGARAALNRLALRDMIDRTKRGREVFYGLTQQTKALLEEGDRRIFGFGESVGDSTTWTVLWHSLPDELRAERSALSRRLRFLGFGSVQDATWLAPHDREEEVVALLRSLDVADHACVLVGRPAAALDVSAVLREAWDLDDVQARYAAFLDEFLPYRTKAAQRRLDDREAFVVLTKATHQFRRFPYLDPELPDRLMPRPAVRPKAIATFHKLRGGLTAPAMRYFIEVAGDRGLAAG
jgi:phenylacetic acid degradation operon negative regulatory protein